jgi:hypothetical protein
MSPVESGGHSGIHAAAFFAHSITVKKAVYEKLL